TGVMKEEQLSFLFSHTNEGANKIAAVAEDDIMKNVKFMVTCDHPLQGDEASSILGLKRKRLETLKRQRAAASMQPEIPYWQPQIIIFGQQKSSLQQGDFLVWYTLGQPCTMLPSSSWRVEHHWRL
ncbi:hypothetical protein KI387_038245, partial [Taxus chinensis]